MTRTLGRASIAALVAAMALAVAPGGAGGQDPPACSQPYSPVATADLGAESLPEVDAAPLPLTNVALEVAPVDSDGDGTDDTVTAGAGVVTIERGDGLVSITGGGTVSATGVLDVDADGREEIAVRSSAGFHLVAGTIAPGSHDVASVGVAMGPSDALGAVGIDDGSGRIVVASVVPDFSDGRTDVIDGAAALAVGGGGTATPLASEAGVPAVVVDLGGSVATLVVVSGRFGADAVDVVLLGVETTRLTTAPAPNQSTNGGWGSVAVLTGAGGTYVVLTRSDRVDSRSWMWSLDDPCTALVAGPADPPTGPAPPAQPVDAAAAFTG